MDSIDIGRAIKAPFNDKQWVSKTLFGFLWLLLGLTAPAVYGAQIEYVKSVAEGREDLPTWDDFGGKWVKGFLLAVAYFLYLLPIWILAAVLLLPGLIASISSGGDYGAGMFGGGLCLFSIISIVYGVAIAILMYGATVNYAMKGGFGALFEISEILAHVRDGSGYFAAWVWALVIGLGGSVVVSVLSATFVGYIAVPAVLYLEFMMMGHVFGQWAAKSYGIAAPATTAPAYVPPAPPAAPAAQLTPPAPPAPTAPVMAPPAPPADLPPAPPEPPAAPSAPEAPPVVEEPTDLSEAPSQADSPDAESVSETPSNQDDSQS
jgi:hypothetical protein